MLKSERIPRVHIVILNWNGGKDTIECLESNYRSNYPEFEVVLVDNGSSDPSVEWVRGWAEMQGISLKPVVKWGGHKPSAYPTLPFVPRALTVIETGRNLGFARGNNCGIEYALANAADMIFLLNNDTLVEPGSLEQLVASIESDPTVGAVYALVLGVDGRIQVPVYLRAPENFWELLVASNLAGFFWRRYQYHAYLERRNPYPNYRYDRLIKLPNLVTACTLYRREFFERVGLFDENVFMYREEEIMLRRLQGTGLAVALEPRARIVHKGGVGTRQLPSALLYLVQARGEMYYVRTYMRLGTFWQLLLKLLRLMQYLQGMAKSAEYRRRFRDFVRQYVAESAAPVD